MKKLFAILAVASLMTACNNSGETTDAAKDSAARVEADLKSADSIQNAAKALLDSAHSKMSDLKDTAAMKMENLKDSTAKKLDKLKDKADKLTEKVKDEAKH